MRTRPRGAASEQVRAAWLAPSQSCRCQGELERTRRALTFKTSFINMAAHELGTPMTPVVFHTRMLRLTQDLPTAATMHLDVLERNVDRLRDLLADLMEAVRMQTYRLPMAPEPLDLRDVADDLVISYGGTADQKAVALALEVLDRPVLAYADPARVAQVLGNLVDNAIKYSPPGTAIVVRVRPSARGGTIEVQDEGMGMTAEQQDRLFEPFQRLHQGAQAPGTGLGLYLSKQIVELQGGTLEGHSAGPGQGCTFRLDLSDELTTSTRRRIDQGQGARHANLDGSIPLP